MTGKSAAQRKRQPSPAELKRQAAASKNEAAQALQAVAQLTDLVKGLMGDVKALKSRPTEEMVRAQHDPAERLINQVLREEDDFLDDAPEKPEVHLPDHLVQASREFDRQRMARNNPVELRKTIDTDEQEIGQIENRTMRSDGPAKESLSPLRAVDEAIVLDNKRYTKAKLDMELFMQELVLVRVHDSTDETQIPMPLSVNAGRVQYFIRGKPQWVKRLFLEPLARAKKTTYSQKLITHDNGTEAYIQIPHTALMYPFDVLQDTQEGKNWLRRILREPR